MTIVDCTIKHIVLVHIQESIMAPWTTELFLYVLLGSLVPYVRSSWTEIFTLCPSFGSTYFFGWAYDPCIVQLNNPK